MRVIDAGHLYEVTELDGSSGRNLRQFVKREGPGYPGNVGHNPGSTMQEELRVLIDRAKYVNNQIQSDCTEMAIHNMREAIFHFELRAAERHGRVLTNVREDIENEPTCDKCGHIQCLGTCYD